MNWYNLIGELMEGAVIGWLAWRVAVLEGERGA